MYIVRGHIYCMGSNEYGNLGIGNNKVKMSSSPCLVEELIHKHCAKVSCGGGHTIVIMNNGIKLLYILIYIYYNKIIGESYSWGCGMDG